MEGFKTYKDRLLKATGDNVDTSRLNEIAKEYISGNYDPTSQGKVEIIDDFGYLKNKKKQLPDVTIGGYSLTFLETMQLGSIVLQLVSIIIAIVIACKMKK